MPSFFKKFFAAVTLCLFALPAHAESLTLSFDKSLQMTQLVAGATPPAAGAQTTQQTITLYPAAYTSRSGQSENIYDFDKKTFTVVNHAAKTYTVYPLHSVSLFRSRDRTSRLGMKITMYQQKTGSGAPPISILTEDIDIDMMLAANNNNKTTEKIKTAKEGGKITFKDDKSLVLATAETAAADTAVPQSLRKTYAHFLVYEFTMHPVIKKALGAESGVFKKLTFTNRDMFRNLAAIYTWTQTAAETQADANAPAIPEDYKRIYHADPELDAAFKAAHTPFVFDGEAFQQEMAALIDQRKYLTGFLKTQQAALSMPPDAVRKNQPYFATAIKAAENFEKAAYLSIIQTPDSPAELLQYNGNLEKAKARVGDMAWLLDYFIDQHTRSVLSAKKNPSKEDLQQLATLQSRLLLMLKKLPHNLGIYERTAEAHYNRLEIPTAMLYWTQAAEIAPTSPSAQKLQQMKTEAEKNFPEYF